MTRPPSFVAFEAARTGRSRRAIYEDLQIARAFAPEELAALKQYDIPRRDALALARLPDHARAAALAASVQVARALDRYGSAAKRTRRCPECGAPFAPRRRDARWCRPACRQRAYRRRRREP